MIEGLTPMGSDFEVTSEIRFAVVMYGGVSLAIYMNGIAQELLHLVRSTARKGWGDDDENEFRFSDQELSGTERVYRELAGHLTPGATKNGVRFIVDILSGTSAGGINGIFLAKALANGQSMKKLEQLWITEGDLGKLLNDDQSTKGVNLPKPSHQKSLLNSDRMYCKLLEAFTGMDFPQGTNTTAQSPAPSASGQLAAELVEELDLFVTTTDIRGRVVPLRTSDRLVYERRYKHAFHFKFTRPYIGPNGPQQSASGQNDFLNDFTLRNNPFLAFAARCTSSFPFAFEPMCFNKVEELVPTYGGYPYRVDLEDWLGFFAQGQKEGPERTELRARAFGDGGYLDNKPFAYAIDTLAKRSSDLPSQRKLLYIEPAPEHPELETSQQRKAELSEPNAIENSLAALVTLPGYEPIREDLMRINERNRVIRKVTELIEGVSKELAAPDAAPSVLLEDQADKAINQLGRGAAYTGYVLLRVYDLTDALANLIAKALKHEQESSYFYAIRCLVRAWREMFYERDEPQQEKKLPIPDGVTKAPPGRTLTAFLKDFDLQYRIRRARFIRTQIDFLYLLDTRAIQRLIAMGLDVPQSLRRDSEDRATLSFQAQLREIKKLVDDGFVKLRQGARILLADNAPENFFAKIDEPLQKQISETLDKVLGVTCPLDKQRGPFAPFLCQTDDDKEYMRNARQILSSARLVSVMNDVALKIHDVIEKTIREEDVLLDGLRGLTVAGSGEIAYAAVMRMFEGYPDYDSAVFPAVYGTDVGELDPVDIIRISPEDADSIVDELRDNVRKLKGTWLGHFGAFLDGRWRSSDILWGRLDASERLIRALLPGEKGASLVEKAHDSILRELVDNSRVNVARELVETAFARASGQAE